MSDPQSSYEWDRDHGSYDGTIAWKPILAFFVLIAALAFAAIWIL